MMNAPGQHPILREDCEVKSRTADDGTVILEIKPGLTRDLVERALDKAADAELQKECGEREIWPGPGDFETKDLIDELADRDIAVIEDDRALQTARSILFGNDIPEALIYIERVLPPNFSGLADRVRRYYEQSRCRCCETSPAKGARP